MSEFIRDILSNKVITVNDFSFIYKMLLIFNRKFIVYSNNPSETLLHKNITVRQQLWDGSNISNISSTEIIECEEDIIVVDTDCNLGDLVILDHNKVIITRYDNFQEKSSFLKISKLFSINIFKLFPNYKLEFKKKRWEINCRFKMFKVWKYQ